MKASSPAGLALCGTTSDIDSARPTQMGVSKAKEQVLLQPFFVPNACIPFSEQAQPAPSSGFIIAPSCSVQREAFAAIESRDLEMISPLARNFLAEMKFSTVFQVAHRLMARVAGRSKKCLYSEPELFPHRIFVAKVYSAREILNEPEHLQALSGDEVEWFQRNLQSLHGWDVDGKRILPEVSDLLNQPVARSVDGKYHFLQVGDCVVPSFTMRIAYQVTSLGIVGYHRLPSGAGVRCRLSVGHTFFTGNDGSRATEIVDWGGIRNRARPSKREQATL